VATGSATRRHRFQPYRFSEYGIDVMPVRCVLDGERTIALAPDADRHLLDLSAHRFMTARLSIQATVTPAILAAVFPPAELPGPPACLALLVRCPPTRLRLAVPVSAAPLQPTTYTATIDLDRANLAGSVELSAAIVRDHARVREDDFADFAGARVADARPWELRIDAARPVHGQYLDIRFQDFRASGLDQFPHPDALYQLDCASEAPILWLNDAHPRLCTALTSTASVGRVARLRDVVFERLEHAVWTRLVARAFHDVSRLGEPAFEWQEPVLRLWLPRLYPTVGDHESRLAALARELEESDSIGVLDRLDGLLQERHETPRALDLLAAELES
jgi:hypothetical protein